MSDTKFKSNGIVNVRSRGIMVISNKFRNGVSARGDCKLKEGTSIGKGELIGSNETIMPHRIYNDAIVDAGSVLVRGIVESGISIDNPAQKIGILSD